MAAPHTGLPSSESVSRRDRDARGRRSSVRRKRLCERERQDTPEKASRPRSERRLLLLRKRWVVREETPGGTPSSEVMCLPTLLIL